MGGILVGVRFHDNRGVSAIINKSWDFFDSRKSAVISLMIRTELGPKRLSKENNQENE